MYFNSMNKKIAILVPTYPPHFGRAYDLLKSFKKYDFNKQADLHFIFTNEEEAEQFGKYEYKIILSNEYRTFIKERNIINLKKIYGLKEIKNFYEYIIVLDSESKFIKKINLFSICQQFFSEKILWGNTTINPVKKIMTVCQQFLPPNTRGGVRQHDNLYLWFNQLCIYKCSTLDEFFEITNMLNSIKQISFFSFEYYIYMYYLILYQGFQVRDLNCYSLFGVMEGYGFIPKPTTDTYLRYTPNACNPYVYNKINNKNVFLFIQLSDDTDRLMNKKNKIRKILSCFIPLKKLRKKFRTS